MTDKRALRFTGDACEQLLIPRDAGAAGRHPATHRPELNEHGAVDRIVLHSAHLLDMLETLQGKCDGILDEAYDMALDVVSLLVGDYRSYCDPETIESQPCGTQPRITCPHGEFKSWQAWADHAIHCQRATDNKGKVMV